MAYIKDIAGQEFHMLKALYREGTGNKGGTTWRCMCQCGKETVAHYGNLVSGNTKSCGCYNLRRIIERNTTHGKAGTTEYNSWAGILARCNNPTEPAYQNYGARGITVCERWRRFENFYADMGERPSPDHSIDRIDNDGNYEPSNCRWADNYVQANNKRNTVLIAAYGKIQSVMQWARDTGLAESAIRARLDRGAEGPVALAPSSRRYGYKGPFCARLLKDYTLEEKGYKTDAH